MRMAKRKKKPISEQLIEAIEASDLSRYRISKETGIAQSTLSEFVNGNRWLSLQNIDLVCDLLGLELKKKGSK
jgi:transcriptional regulator with XRE-family HTH domain